jgi:hypothetical protein
MAEATKTNRRQNNVVGMRRTVTWDSVAFAASGDTVTVPGLKRLEDVSFTPTTNVSFGFTVLGNVATIVSGGAVTGLMQVSGI